QSVRRAVRAAHAPRARHVAARGSARVQGQGGLVVKLWQASSSNVARVSGRVLLNGAPVKGVTVAMDGYRIPDATGEEGRFSTDVDITIPQRRVLRPVVVAHASAHGPRVVDG